LGPVVCADADVVEDVGGRDKEGHGHETYFKQRYHGSHFLGMTLLPWLGVFG